MVDPNEAELAAMQAAAQCAGAFIDGIGQTDMARWPERQWHDFIATVCGGYVDSLVEQQAAVQSAMGKVRSAP